jgi:hypothetical protein
MTLTTTQDPECWRRRLDEMGFDDAYYGSSYGQIWEAEESAEWVGVSFDAGREGQVVYPVLRDPLTYLPEADGCCDIRTAYDFGGPVVRGRAPAEAMRKFRAAFSELADDWGAVTEFARLHPYRVDPLPEEATFHANNLHVDLSLDLAEIRGAYDEPHTRRIEQAREAGVTVEVYEGGRSESQCDHFIELYYRTMLRVGAGGHYFFLPETLRKLVGHEDMALAVARLEAEDKTIGAGLFFQSGETLFYFLSGSHPSYLECRPNNLMLDQMVEFGRNRGFERLHLGGGSDSLRRFKGQVANGSTDYYIVTKVHDPEAYERLARSVGEVPDEGGAFPVYWPRKYTDRQRPPLF